MCHIWPLTRSKHASTSSANNKSACNKKKNTVHTARTHACTLLPLSSTAAPSAAPFTTAAVSGRSGLCQDCHYISQHHYTKTVNAAAVSRRPDQVGNGLALIGFLTTRGMHWYHCLLYTSPSPRDKRQSRMPSSA